MPKRMTSQRVILTASFLMLAGGGTAACDNDSADGHFYCSDASGTVVDEDYCDDTSSSYNPGYFIWYGSSSVHGSSSYPVGSKLPAGGQKFSVTDKASRTKFGLPASGKVSNGTVKTGVLGKGGAGLGSTGKSGSGAKSGG